MIKQKWKEKVRKWKDLLPKVCAQEEKIYIKSYSNKKEKEGSMEENGCFIKSILLEMALSENHLNMKDQLNGEKSWTDISPQKTCKWPNEIPPYTS